MTIADDTADDAPPHRRATRSVRDLPAAERPRERLALRGPGGLSAAELIALVLGTGGGGRSAIDLAEALVRRHDSLRALARASDVELAGMPGLGQAKAARLAAAFELGRRSVADWPAGRWTIRSPGDVARPLLADMGRLEREELRVLSLNTKNVVQRVTTAYVGNVSASLVRIGELFRDAVRLDAAGIVLVHNHPSGDPTPSPDDLHLTAEAIAAGRLLDVDVLDHVVIGHDAWVSLRDRGVAFDRAAEAAIPPGRAITPGSRDLRRIQERSQAIARPTGGTSVHHERFAGPLAGPARVPILRASADSGGRHRDGRPTAHEGSDHDARNDHHSRTRWAPFGARRVCAARCRDRGVRR